ncbi:MAG: ferredoxin [Chromatiales bacterium]|nr:ferredoxin [Chromatiales bacterium]
MTARSAKKMQGDPTLPVIPPAVKDSDATKQIMHTLRHFHLGNPSVQQQVQRVGSDYLPALLEPYRDASRLRYDYPLFLFDAASEEANPTPEQLARPVAEVLSETVASFAPGDESARILKDNLPWLERELRQKLTDVEGPVDAAGLVKGATEALVAFLKLDEKNIAKLREDIDRLLAALPANGHLLAYGRYPAIHLLVHSIRSRVIPRHVAFRGEIEEHIRELKNLLDVDRSKSADSKRPETLSGSMGGGSSLIDTSALSKVMGQKSQGSVSMSAERRARIESALQTLQTYQQSNTLVHFIHNGPLEGEWLSSSEGFQTHDNNDPCGTATRLFDEEAVRLAKVFAANRIARLEINRIYDAAIHDPFFANFNWEAFSREELLLVPAVIALESANHMANEGMPAFSRLLSSGRPVQIFVRVLAHNNPSATGDEDPFQNYRTELGYLGIAHRQAVVSQASAARHVNLLKRFAAALDATRTSLHLVNIGLRPTGQDLGLNAWLVAGAALEGRVHPAFSINPAAGDAFADRMDFSGNPQQERDWPLHPFKYLDDTGVTVEQQLAFTFADYALLLPRLHHHFAVVPAECDTDALVPVAEFLQMADEKVHEHVPFIWAVGNGGVLYRIVISRALIQACRDRLNFWHTLQEMAGVRNKHIDNAIAATRTEVEAKAAEEKAALTAEFEAELSRVRAEAASEVMGKLTDVLLGMDFSSGAPRPTFAVSSASATPSTEVVEEAIADEPSAVEEEEEVLVEDPWIDTPLCTSCNDCLAINPLMFIYDDSNMALLGDLTTGTYKQMVEAAEICPSRCIHPGQPWNPGEPNLDELKERAAKFN